MKYFVIILMRNYIPMLFLLSNPESRVMSGSLITMDGAQGQGPGAGPLPGKAHRTRGRPRPERVRPAPRGPDRLRVRLRARVALCPGRIQRPTR